MAYNKEEIISAIEQMSVLDLADLVKALEERFGVTAAAPVMMGGGGGGGAAATEAAAPEEEQTEFNVVLTDFGANKIGVIKVVRDLVPGLGLREAKELVEGAPKNVLEAVTKDAANAAKSKLEEAGAKADVK